MNLITAVRRQLKEMENWYMNALITNVVLDYLDLETNDPRRNIQIIQDLIESGRVKSFYEGTKQLGMVYYVDDIRVLTIFDTVTEVQGGAYNHLDTCTLNLKFSYRRDWKDKPTQQAVKQEGNIVPIIGGNTK